MHPKMLISSILIISLMIVSGLSYTLLGQVESQNESNTTNIDLANLQNNNQDTCSLDIVIVFDKSKSSIDNFNVIKSVLFELLNTFYRENYRISIVAFNETYEIIRNLDYMDASIYNQVVEQVNNIEPAGGSNIYGALAVAKNILDSEGFNGTYKKIILISDGVNTVERTTKKLFTLKKKIEGNNIDIYTIFIGRYWTGGNRLMFELATEPDYYFEINRTTDINYIRESLVPDVMDRLCVYPDIDRDGLKDTIEVELAEKYVPILIFDSMESYYPTRAEFFYSNIGLYVDGVLITTEITNSSELVRLAPAPWIDERYSDSLMYIDYGNDNAIDLDLVKNNYQSSQYYYEYVIYYHVTRLPNKMILVDYWFFYAGDRHLNMHEGDWEHVALILDKDLQPVKYYISWHLFIAEVDYDRATKYDTHILIVVGEGSHASYDLDMFLSCITPLEHNDLNGLILVPQNVDKNAVMNQIFNIALSHGKLINRDTSRIVSITDLVNMGEPTNYRKAFELLAKIKKKGHSLPFSSLLLRTHTEPLINGEFLDSGVRWGVCGVDLGILNLAKTYFYGPEGPAMHIDYYLPSLKFKLAPLCIGP